VSANSTSQPRPVNRNIDCDEKIIFWTNFYDNGPQAAGQKTVEARTIFIWQFRLILSAPGLNGFPRASSALAGSAGIPLPAAKRARFRRFRLPPRARHKFGCLFPRPAAECRVMQPFKPTRSRAGAALLLTAIAALPVALFAWQNTGEPASATVDPATAHAALRDPKAAFWNQPAPEVFRVKIETTNGFFVIEAHRDWAPRGTDRFYNLVRAGFFDDSRFHRVDPRYIAQFGVPGDPAIAGIWRNQTFPDDPPKQSNLRGTIGFAAPTNSNSRTTQLYINLVDNVRNDAQGFALLGRVVEGMDVVDHIYSGYGENSGGGIRAGKQDRLFTEGNAWLDRDFPKLDKLVRASVLTNSPQEK